MQLSPTPTPARPAGLRIVQCARDIGPGLGVAGPAWELERCFKEAGHRCDRFTLSDLGIRSVAESPARSRLGAFVGFWRDVVVFSTLGTLAVWWRYRRSGPETVVVCHVDALVGDLFVVRSLHKAYLDRQPGKLWRLLRNPLHGFVLLRDAIRFRAGIHRRFIALSAANSDELTRLYGVDSERISVIPNGVDCDRFRPDPNRRREERRSLGISDSELTVAFVSNEFYRKGLGVVLDAMKELSNRLPSCRLLVAGDDRPEPYRAQLDALGDRVLLLGHRPDVERVLAAADVFVLPTLHELSALVGLEAMATGLPVLMTSVGGSSEYLRDGENGWFVARDPGEIAQRLRQLAGDPALRERMGRRSRELAYAYDWSVTAERFLEVIGEVLAAREGKRPVPAEGPKGP